MCSQPSQLQRGLSQSMALWKHSRSHAVSYQTKMGLVSFSPKNRTSSCLQNATCFACLERWSRRGLSARGHINPKVDITSHHKFSSSSWKSRTPRSLAQKIGGTGAGLSLSFAVSGIANAEGLVDDGIDATHTSELSASCAHGKKVYTKSFFTAMLCYTCLPFVVVTSICRFIEGDFDTYVSQIRKRHVWGGEPELLMASHILRMPITVYMHEEAAGGLIAIAEYGQEYGKEDAIRVLYHGCGHYEALQIPGNAEPRSRL